MALPLPAGNVVVSGPRPPAARWVRLDPPYPLRDPDGRAEALEELTAAVGALQVPVQAWHGPVPCPPPPDGPGEAARLARELAARARGRRTLLLPAGQAAAAGPADAAGPLPGWDQAGAEGPGTLRLAGGGCGRVLALTGWPATVHPGWLEPVAARSAAVVLHLRPVPDGHAARLLRRRLTALASTAALDDRTGRLPDPADRLAADAAADLGARLAGGRTRLLHAQLLVALHAPDPAGLDRLQAEIADRLAGLLAGADPLRLRQGPAWAACRPGGPPLGWPWRLLDAASVAASLPHPAGPQPPAQLPPARATRPVLVGAEPETGVPVLADRWAAHNPTRLVVGTSGAGKSYAAKLELLRQAVTGAGAVIVDPEGEFGPIAEALGGLCLQVGAEPAGLDPVGLACRQDRDGTEGTDGIAGTAGLALLTSWAAALLGGPLDPVDVALLDRALGVLRADLAGTHTGAAPGPTPADLLAVVADLADHPPFVGANLPARLAPAAGGTLGALFAPNPELRRPPPVVCFDLRDVPDRARPAVMCCVLSWAAARSEPERRLVILDEAHLLLDDPPAAGLLAQFARRARKHGFALDVLTQRLSDFLAHPAGEALLANAATALLLGCEQHERDAVAGGLHLTRAEAAWLRPGAHGRGLLVGPAGRCPVQVLAGDAEHVLASLGPRR